MVEAEGIDCGYHRGGTVVLARTPAQLQRTHEEVADARRRGIGEEDLRFLPADEARRAGGGHRRARAGRSRRTAPPSTRPAWCGAWPRWSSAGGVPVYERTTVRSIAPGLVTTDRGTVRAGTVVRATEGYTRTLAGHERDLVPVYSLMIATEPLPDSFWAEVGLAGRETFADHRHLVIYGQRTEDGRMAFGGRGAPYHFGSTIRPAFDRDAGRPRGPAPHPGRAVPGPGRRRGHPRLGRPAGHLPRLVLVGGHRRGHPAWPGPAATSATGCRPPTWPAAPCATSSSERPPS